MVATVSLRKVAIVQGFQAATPGCMSMLEVIRSWVSLSRKLGAITQTKRVLIEGPFQASHRIVHGEKLSLWDPSKLSQYWRYFEEDSASYPFHKITVEMR